MKHIINTKAEKGLLLTDIVIIVAIFVTIFLIVKGVSGLSSLTKDLEKKKNMPQYTGANIMSIVE